MGGSRVVCLMVVLLLVSSENTVRADDAYEYEYYYEEVPASFANNSESNPDINTAADESTTTAEEATVAATEGVTGLVAIVELSTVQPDDDDTLLPMNSGMTPSPEARTNISFIQTVHPSGVWQTATPNNGQDYKVTAQRRSGTTRSSRQDFGRPEIVLNIFTDMYGQVTRNRNNRGGNSRSKGGRNSYWNSYQNSLQGWYGWQGPRNNRNYGMPSWQQSRGNSVYRGRQPLPVSNGNRRPQPVTNTSNRRNADQQANEALYNFLRQMLQGSQVQTAVTNNQPRRNNNRRPS